MNYDSHASPLPVAILTRYIPGAMDRGLQHKFQRSAILASLLALIVGPSASAAQARYVQRAWLERKSASDKARARATPAPHDIANRAEVASDTTDFSHADSSSKPPIDKTSSGRDRVITAFVPPTAAKPTESQSSDNFGIDSPSPAACGVSPVGGIQCVFESQTARSTCHRHANRSHAPPVD